MVSLIIHCYVDQLNLIMEKAAIHNSEVGTLLSSLYGTLALSSRSPQYLAALDLVSKKIPEAPILG